MKIIAGPEGLTPAWLTEILNTRIDKVDVEAIGTGQMVTDVQQPVRR
ncbi:hypothetical protein [Actinomadura sp. 3N407]